jgi:hypothetical protein
MVFPVSIHLVFSAVTPVRAVAPQKFLGVSLNTVVLCCLDVYEGCLRLQNSYARSMCSSLALLSCLACSCQNRILCTWPSTSPTIQAKLEHPLCYGGLGLSRPTALHNATACLSATAHAEPANDRSPQLGLQALPTQNPPAALRLGSRLVNCQAGAPIGGPRHACTAPLTRSSPPCTHMHSAAAAATASH